jgi:hypothetical protein
MFKRLPAQPIYTSRARNARQPRIKKVLQAINNAKCSVDSYFSHHHFGIVVNRGITHSVKVVIMLQ